jgi:hypothetical protein
LTVNTEDIVNNLVEVTLPSADNFLKVKETLTRIGISSKTERKLYQSCHILHKRGKYYIVHFKELFMLDGLANDFSDSDKARRNTIVNLLEQWGLVKIVNPAVTKEPVCPISHFKILPFGEKKDWELIPKYRIGVRKKPLDGESSS